MLNRNTFIIVTWFFEYVKIVISVFDFIMIDLLMLNNIFGADQ